MHRVDSVVQGLDHSPTILKNGLATGCVLVADMYSTFIAVDVAAASYRCV